MPAADRQTGACIEIWLQARRIRNSGTFLALYVPSHLKVLFRQSETDLEIEIRQEGQGAAGTAKLYAYDVFRSPNPRFLTIVSGIGGTSIYVDGALVRATPRFLLPSEAFTGRLIIGDSPNSTDSWAGHIFGLGIYHRKLDQPQRTRHLATSAWQPLPYSFAGEDAVALYPMDERAGRIVHDRSGNGLDLSIPETYAVVDEKSLEPFWQEFSMSRSYWSAAFKNVIGFVPFGCCFSAWLTRLRFRHPTLATVILGAAVSLTIEILQAHLPTRDSGTTDIITNTLGTWLGVASYGLVRPLVSGRLRWIPIAVSGLGTEEGN
jgi:VanZ family protein